MTDISRRTAVLGAAWAVPVIMAAVAVPLAAASTVPEQRIPLECTRVEKKGQPLYHIAYNDGSTEVLTNGEVNSDKVLQALCRDKGPLS